MECCNNRPNRSDIHLSKEEEGKIEANTREYFNGITPKRHTKPQRSEYSSKYVDDNTTHHHQEIIPELLEFQRLENFDHHHDQKLVYKGSEAADEFVETEYYEDLNCIDKQHHTTGTGFIKMQEKSTSEKSYNLAPDSFTNSQPSGKSCNPATNDWIPETSNTVPFDSDKPNRSDS